MKCVIYVRRLLERLRSSSPRSRTTVLLAGLLGLFALGAQVHPWTVIGFVVVGLLAGVAAVVAAQVVHRRFRQRANTNRRLGSLESLAVEHRPLQAEPSQRSDRPASGSNAANGSVAERVAEMRARYESQGSNGTTDPDFDDDHEFVDELPTASRPPDDTLTPVEDPNEPESGFVVIDDVAGDPRPIADEVHDSAAESPARAGSPAVIESSPVADDPTGEGDLVGPTGAEMASLFNRYEDIARTDVEGLTDDGRDFDAEIWLDLTQGEAWPYIDATRRTAEGLWVYLRSGEVVCKLQGSDAWTCVDDREREPARPAVIVSLVPAREPTEPTFVIALEPSTERTQEQGTAPGQPQ